MLGRHLRPAGGRARGQGQQRQRRAGRGPPAAARGACGSRWSTRPTRPTRCPPCDLVIDAAYGTGFRGEYHGAAIAGGAPVLAVDIPSGVDGLTGEAAGRRARAPTRTVTFAALKPGLLLEPGRDAGRRGRGGRHRARRLAAPRPTSSRPPTSPAGCRTGRRRPTSGSARCGSWPGRPGMTGAAALARRGGAAGRRRLRAAQHARAAPTTAGVPVEVVRRRPARRAAGPTSVLDGLDRFARARRRQRPRAREARRATPRSVAPVVAASAVPTVVDGDGLTALGADVGRRVVGPRRTVLTPHDGEFDRLAGAAARAPTASPRPATWPARPARSCCSRARPRSSPTRTARCSSSTTGDARLATAGTGDVLAGDHRRAARPGPRPAPGRGRRSVPPRSGRRPRLAPRPGGRRPADPAARSARPSSAAHRPRPTQPDT